MQVWFWAAFIALILGMLALDLGVLNRGSRVPRVRDALLWSGFCAFMALAFGVGLYFIYEHNWLGISQRGPNSGRDAFTEYITAWIIEQSLSLDNIFVIALIFNYFAVPREHQHRTLFWGIMGALVMRGAMILAGAALIEKFHWIIYVFGLILLWTAYKMWRGSDEKIEPERNPLVRMARRYFPISDRFDGERFFTRIHPEPGTLPSESQVEALREFEEQPTKLRMAKAGVLAATPMFLVLLVIESTDLLFAVDSIPACFAVTRDPFIVFTSNVFAILNLRSLYFALADMLERFHLLKPSLVIILAYVGIKMLLSDVYHIPTAVSLIVIAVVLAGGTVGSLMFPKRHESPAGGAKPGDATRATEP